jgi:hypothetical protein
MKMKKIISVCLCICLMSGCDKSLRHGSPANAVVEDKGSEGVPTHSLTSDTSALVPSNTPAPTPEPQPLSDSADTGSSVGKIVLCVVALAVITCAVIYRLVSPEIFEHVDIVPENENVDTLMYTSEQLILQGYKRCCYGQVCSTSYTCRFFKKVKKTIYHWSYLDFATGQPIRGVPTSLCKAGLSLGLSLHYKPEPAPSDIGE